MFRRIFPFALFVGVAALAAGPAPGQDKKALAAELKRLDGTWEVLGAVRDGESVPKEKRDAMRLVVKAGAYEQRVDGKAVEKGKVRFVGEEQKVLFVEFTPADGPNKGKALTGLLEWLDPDGARVTVPLKAGGGRPLRPGSEPGSGMALMIYKRAQE